MGEDDDPLMLSFLVPLFLAGLVLVGVPLWIHLTRRDRGEVVPFPSLRFLRATPDEKRERRRLRDLPLLLLRALAVILLVAAFARPFSERGGAGATGASGPVERVVLLDRSHSMTAGDRWERAVEAARGAILSANPEDRTTLVFFDDRAEAPIRSGEEATRVAALLDEATPSDGATRYGPALQLARSILDGSELANRELVAISDFPGGGFGEDEPPELPVGTVVRTVPVAEEPLASAGVVALQVDRESNAGREQARVAARVRLPESPGEPRALTLEVDGQVVETARITPEAPVVSYSFAPVPLTPAGERIVVRVDDTAVGADDARYEMLRSGRETSVLVVGSGGAGSGNSLFLDQALGVSGDRAFRVESRRAPAFGPGELRGRQVVIWNDAPFARGTAGEALRDFVAAGGGLLVVLGEDAAGNPGSGDFLPASIGGVDDPPGGEARIGWIDYTHPVFEPFAGPRGGDFASARFFRRRAITPVEGARVVARFDDGSAALVEGRHGRGRILVWASTLDRFWSDLPLQPVFLPLTHQMVGFLDTRPEPLPSFTVGQVLDLADPRLAAALGVEAAAGAAPQVDLWEGWVLLDPSGNPVDLPAAAASATSAARPVVLRRAGWYRLREAGVPEPRTHWIAVNVDPDETTPELPGDPEEWAARVAPTRTEDGARMAGTGPTERERERSQALWRTLLWMAFGLLVLEGIGSNRRGRIRGYTSPDR